MPVDPVLRAQFRLALFRIETDWYSLAEEAETTSDGRLGSKSRKLLRESILQSTELFGARPFFLSDEFSLVDASIAPVLWRLPVYGIELGSQAKPIEEYMTRVFARRSFQQSLTELEQEMRL
jgi:RNA polymerase-associated protein